MVNEAIKKWKKQSAELRKKAKIREAKREANEELRKAKIAAYRSKAAINQHPNAPKQHISVKPNIPAPTKLDPHKKPGMGLKPGPKLNAQQAQHLANTLKARKA